MYKLKIVKDAHATLEKLYESLDDKSDVLKSKDLNELLSGIKSQPKDTIAQYGKEVNVLKQEFVKRVKKWQAEQNYQPKSDIDVTAPFDVNQTQLPELIRQEDGSCHPIMSELDKIIDIFNRMGFKTIESRQLDNQYYMFDSLNFPDGHPARDHYDTFLLDEKDEMGRPLVGPAHASIMQNRVLKANKSNLKDGEPISYIYTGRVFRNEDLDARHEHTFYQVEFMHVDKDVTVSNLITWFKEFLVEYYQQEVEVRTQPFYFPFTEPSFELAMSCPFCKKKGCKICSQAGWIELLGMGMVHPNVLKMGGIDPKVYTGFAGGIGLERLIMMKHGIEDIRHFESGKLEFMRQFK